jgi:oligoribonuclease
MLGVFVDTETSGLDPFLHVPIDLGVVVVDLSSGEEKASYETLLTVTDEEWHGKDPNSAAIHGLTFEQLATGVSRSAAAKAIEKLLVAAGVTNDKAFFICQNPSFDRPFFAKIIPQYRQEALQWPYHWLDLASMYWALVVTKGQHPVSQSISVSKDSIASALGLPPEKRPHRAINGVRHLISCYERLVGFPDSGQAIVKN